MERSLILVKPDAAERKLGSTIIARFEQLGLRMIALKMLHPDRALAEKHYDIHRDKPFFRDLVDYITSGPIIAAAFEGEGAVDLLRKAMGPTDPAKADAGTIRGDFGLDIQRNSVHGSDSPETAVNEISRYFSEGEIFSPES